jgi:hypothetical protein
MENGWACIYSTANLCEAAINKGYLEDNDVGCVILNKQDSLTLIGDVELYVMTEHILIAKRLISETKT